MIGSRMQGVVARGRDRGVAMAARLADAVDRRRVGAPSIVAQPIERRLEAMERATAEQVQRTMDIQARARRTQALAARAYEAAFDWPGQLATIRSEAEYDGAWEESEPLVSVRIATYNRADLLCERALASVRAQTYEHWEAIVVGDALTDDTEARIRAIGDPRIRFFNLPVRGPYPVDEFEHWLVGGTAPVNAALREVRGRWIAPLDDDDAWDDDHLEVLLEHARETGAELVYGRLRTSDAATGTPLSHEVGSWPPAFTQFGIQAALFHGALRRFEYDSNALWIEESADWNLVRRLWDAGVRFSYLDRVVGTYFMTPRDENSRLWMADLLREAAAGAQSL
jgi:hypothetical protein